MDAEAAKGDSASVIKKEMLAYLNDNLLPYLTVAAVVDQTGYGDLAEKVEIEVERANSSVSRRLKSGSKSSDETAASSESAN
ncbi:MAG: hypothetical protein K6G80_11285 [Treponema sp.]|nr:hypothetical protein [Treponema sp.]